MHLGEIFAQSIESLRGNKMRSFLTMLGIVMGVFSIIAIIATGNAVKVYINGEFEKFGANTVTISAKDVDESDESRQLAMSDVEVVRQAVEGITSIVPYDQYALGSVRVGGEEVKTLRLVVIGVTPEAREQGTTEILSGRYITDADVKSRSMVCLINASFADRYFHRTDVVGEKIRVKDRGGANVSFTVVGVIKSEIDSLSAIFGDDMPVFATIPISTAMGMSGDRTVSSISFVMGDSADLRDAGLAAVKAVEFVHHVEDAFIAQNSDDMLNQLNSILGMVQIALGVIAAITLAVGGIGIVNILLVSVTERTREIGIRKAIGAQKRDIVLQFVAEAVMMTGVSGVIGIAMGVGMGSIVSAAIKIPPVVDVPTILFAFLFSLVLGLAFGVYPAKRAADLDPIESLRYE